MTQKSLSRSLSVAASEASSATLAYWLFTCVVMVSAIIIVGAITRLTESGLSMVEWRAMIDMLPPLSQQAWMSEFQKYQLTPEYLKINHGMSLDEFKNIYFWEWFHRLLGRLVGLVYALPLVYFWVRKKIPSAIKPRLLFFLFLGGLQGFFGWYMVKSGLINEPRVSHYRLALHFGTALLLLVLLWCQALALWPRSREWMRLYFAPLHTRLLTHGWIALAVVCVTILYGAFVAGLDAGLIYNEFPLMGGRIVPSEFMFMKPAWLNFLQNHATVQWTHRVLGTLSFVTVFALALRAVWSKNYVLVRIGYTLAIVILLQFILGIVTLLSGVHLHAAVTHQGGAVATMLVLVTLIQFLRTDK